MATTTAKITLASSDLLSDTLNLVLTSTLTAAGGSTGLTQATGVGRTTTLATDVYTVFAAASATDNKGAKVYFHNTSSTATEYFIIRHASQVIGRLYAGDWAFYPWDGASDIIIVPSVATIMTLEHCAFHDNPTS